MTKPWMSAALVLTAGLTLSACVSGKKYRALEAEHQSLRASYDEARAKSADLEKQATSLQEVNESLKKDTDDTKSQYENLVGQLQQELEQGQLKITQYKNMLTVDVAEQIFFDSGKATLKPTGQDVLTKVGAALASYPDKLIRVVGHTDNVPVTRNKNVFPDNWELSVTRATNVVRFLQEKSGVPAERLVASGRAEFDPIAPNDSPEGRQKNRRIEIMLMDKSVVDAMEGAPPAAQ